MEEEQLYSQSYSSTAQGLIPQLIDAINQSLQNYLPSNAAFLCERLVSEQDNEENRNLLAKCYLQENKLYKVYQVLKNTKEEQNKYLFGVVCNRLNLDKEAERALKSVNNCYSQVVLGNIYEKWQRHADASQCYHRAIESNPTLWVAYEKLVRMGEQEQPSRIFQEKIKKKITRKESDSKDKESSKGMTFLMYQKMEEDGKLIKSQSKQSQQHQQSQQSMSQYKKIGSINQGSLMQLLRKFGDAYYQMCFYRTPDAINSFSKLPPPHNNSNLALISIARCYMELTKYQEAENYFSKVFNLKSQEMFRLEGVDYYSSCLWHLKKQVELCQLANRCLECSMYASETWIVVGNCFSLQKEHENALKFFNRAIQLNPNNAYAHSLCGLEYTYNEDFPKAQKCFESALNIDMRLYNAWWGLGNVHFKQEKHDKAIKEFERASAINSGCPVLYTYLGMAYSNKGDYRLALQKFEESELLEPTNALNKYQKANALVKLEQYDAALSELDKLRIMMPRESPIPILMGTIYKKLGKIKEAHQQFTYALDMEPRDAQRIKSLIESLHHGNDFNEDMDYA